MITYLPIRAQIGKENSIQIFWWKFAKKKKNKKIIGSLWKPYHEIEQPTISSLVVNGPWAKPLELWFNCDLNYLVNVKIMKLNGSKLEPMRPPSIITYISRFWWWPHCGWLADADKLGHVCVHATPNYLIPISRDVNK